MQPPYQRDFYPDPLADDFDQSPCEFWDDSARSVLPKLPPRGVPEARAHLAQPIGSTALADIPGVVRASRLEHPAVPTVSSGITPIDSLTGGLPRGGLTEICGPASSGRTSILLSIMAAATARGELCALIDAADCFSPHAAAAAGVDLDRVLWVRCTGATSTHAADKFETAVTPDADTFRPIQDSLRSRQNSGSIMPPAKVWYGRPPARSERATATRQAQRSHPDLKFKIQNSKLSDREISGERRRFRSHQKLWAARIDQALKVADLLLQSGGFGLVILDFADVPSDIARRIPLTSWFRFRRAVENTPAVLLALARESCAGSCASLVLQTAANGAHTSTMSAEDARSATPAHARIFAGLNVQVEIVRSRNETSAGERKPPRPAHAAFQNLTNWAG